MVFNLIVNILLKKIFRGNLNEVISTNEIGSFRFPRKIFLNRKSRCVNLGSQCYCKFVN